MLVSCKWRFWAKFHLGVYLYMARSSGVVRDRGMAWCREEGTGKGKGNRKWAESKSKAWSSYYPLTPTSVFGILAFLLGLSLCMWGGSHFPRLF